MSTLLFKHVNVVDVRNQQILSDVDVWIKNERIEKIGRDIKSSAPAATASAAEPFSRPSPTSPSARVM